MISFDKHYLHILQDIHLADTKSIKKDLEYLPIENLDDKAIDKLLGTLGDLCLESSHPKLAMREIINRWLNKSEPHIDKEEKNTSTNESIEDQEVEGSNITFFEGAFYNIWVSVPALKLMAEILDHYTFSRLVANIIDVVYEMPGHSVDYGLKKMVLVYNPKDRDEVLALWKRAKAKYNMEVSNFLMSVLRTSFNPVYASKPEWILTEENIPKSKDLKLNTPYTPPKLNSSQLSKYTNHAFHKELFDIVDLSGLIKKYDVLDDIDKRTLYIELERTGLIDDIIVPTDQEIERFRIYGPSNPVKAMTDKEYELNYDCMLESPYLNYEDVFGDSGDELNFDGVCWECDKTIKHKHYSFRIPMDTGGWLGWFCSIKCAEDWMERRFENDEDEYRVANIMRLIIKFKTNLNKYKIYERK